MDSSLALPSISTRCSFSCALASGCRGWGRREAGAEAAASGGEGWVWAETVAQKLPQATSAAAAETRVNCMGGSVPPGLGRLVAAR